jgi:hypothetical protein
MEHDLEFARKRSLERSLRLGVYEAMNPVINIDNTVNVEKDGLFGILLGFSYGIQFNPVKPGVCYDTLETTLNDLSNLVFILT